MADKSPLKATYSGSDTNGLAEFESDDTVAIADGGTGASTAGAALTALGASPTAGSSSLTTLGTIATGTWEATDIAIAHGGTGASTASEARTNLGITDTTPGGSNKQVQFNNSSAFGGSANLAWDNSNNRLGIGTDSPAANLHVETDKVSSDYIGYFHNTRTSDGGVQYGVKIEAGFDNHDDVFKVADGNDNKLFQIRGNGNIEAGLNGGHFGIGKAPEHVFHVQDVGQNSFNTKAVFDLEGTRRSGYTQAAIELASEYGTGGSGNFRTSAIAAELVSDQSATDIVFYSESAERMRLLSGGGLTFNGDTAAANALDDYEEGTWTATLTYSSSYTTYTCTENTGKYVKIGRLVYVTSNINVTNPSASNSSSVGINVTGLPFTVTNDTACHSRIIFDLSKYNGGSTVMGMTAYVIPNTTIIQPLRIWNNGTGWSAPNTAEFYLSSGTAGVFITGCYHTDA